VLQASFPGERVRDYLRTERQQYFSACEHSYERNLLRSDASVCGKAVIYDKGMLGYLTLSDYLGQDEFGAHLRRLIEEHRAPKPSLTRREFMSMLFPEPLHDNQVLLRGQNWNDVNEGRVTYSNQAKARRDGDAIEVRATVRAYTDGMRDRVRFNTLATVPLGIIDCDGNPQILTWITAIAWSETTYRLAVPGPVSQAGVDPWGELLDDGNENMVPVVGEAACHKR
jgi:hypothetical protein